MAGNLSSYMTLVMQAESRPSWSQKEQGVSNTDAMKGGSSSSWHPSWIYFSCLMHARVMMDWLSSGMMLVMTSRQSHIWAISNTVYCSFAWTLELLNVNLGPSEYIIFIVTLCKGSNLYLYKKYYFKFYFYASIKFPIFYSTSGMFLWCILFS